MPRIGLPAVFTGCLQKEGGKLYIWLTEHPLPMAPFDDGVLFAGVMPPG
jgi:hypothetical protein